MKPPLVKQTTDYTCGCAVLTSALQSFGYKTTESELAEILKTKDYGTEQDSFREAARKFDVYCEVTQNTKVHDLLRGLATGQLIILDLQLWGSGHYVLLFGANPREIKVMDPWIGKYCTLSWKKFLSRWFNKSRGRSFQGVAIYLGDRI